VAALGIGAGAKSGEPEYVIVQGTVFGREANLDIQINQRVGQGWELVSVAHSTEHYGFAVMRRSK
jgi:hypothetical protein